METSFQDRMDAGRALARALTAYSGRPDVLVLALPRGGVPVGFEVAVALAAPLDVFLVRKLGLPRQEELAMGALATGGVRVINEDVVDSLRVPASVVDEVTAREQQELERREELYRDGRPMPQITGRTVILVDDGLATGSTMRAAVAALRLLNPAKIVVGVPVGASATCNLLRKEADEVVCVISAELFFAVGAWYEDFSQTTDEEVRGLLAKAAARFTPVDSVSADTATADSTTADAAAAVKRQAARPVGHPGNNRNGVSEVTAGSVSALVPGNAGGQAVAEEATDERGLNSSPTSNLAARLRSAAIPLRGAEGDYDALLEWIGDSRFVLLGEASHGTHEFYEARAEISRRLISEKGFGAIAVEADWPDAYRVNRFVRGAKGDSSCAEALSGFQRFPEWMWRNTDVLGFVEWLRAYNDSLPPGAEKVGFYGLDLYSLHSSIEAVLQYLDRVDPDAAQRARYRYGCFEHFGEDTQAYGYAASLDLSESCQREVLDQLRELQRRSFEYEHRDGRLAEDEYFFVEQNARLVKNAEEYYRTMFRGRVSSWNIRDSHMADTLHALTLHFARRVREPKIVVWEHNSHLGDARATRMGDEGEWNVGQLVRERHGNDAFLVGFTTHSGMVTAASEWGQPARRKQVNPSLEGSFERLFHETGIPNFILPLRGSPLAEELRQPRLERAIGVIYLPQSERYSHYFHARLADQFDTVIHFDETRAVEPLDPGAHWGPGEVPETYPTGV